MAMESFPQPRTRSEAPAGAGPGMPARSAARTVARVALAVVLANALFLGLAYLAAARPDVAAQRARTAFRTGELGTIDWPSFDARRGDNQYNDCTVLQMLANQGRSRLYRTLAPTVYGQGDWRNMCLVLREAVTGRLAADTMVALEYTRYWHGYNVLTAFGLRVMELGTFRRTLAAGVWLAVVALAAASWRAGGAIRATGLAVAASSATVWALPYFAPSLTHGIADGVMMVWLAGLAWWMGRARRLDAFPVVAALFGATAIFFDVMLGTVQTAIAWLAALSAAAAMDRAGDERGSSAEAAWAPVRMAGVAGGAFVAGAGMSLAIKQLLASALIDPGAAGNFGGKLSLYMQVPPPGGVRGILVPFAHLWSSAGVLGYGHAKPVELLVVLAVVAWAVAAGLALGGKARPAVVVLLAAAGGPVMWTLFVPTHTAIHARLVVRMLVVPVTLAPLALWWAVRSLPAHGLRAPDQRRVVSLRS
jgi:hypothetical protein